MDAKIKDFIKSHPAAVDYIIGKTVDECSKLVDAHLAKEKNFAEKWTAEYTKLADRYCDVVRDYEGLTREYKKLVEEFKTYGKAIDALDKKNKKLTDENKQIVDNFCEVYKELDETKAQVRKLDMYREQVVIAALRPDTDVDEHGNVRGDTPEAREAVRERRHKK